MSGATSLLAQFRDIVIADPALQQEWRRAPDRASFVTLVVARARERGCALSAGEVEAALETAKRAWLLAWMAR